MSDRLMKEPARTKPREADKLQTSRPAPSPLADVAQPDGRHEAPAAAEDNMGAHLPVSDHSSPPAPSVPASTTSITETLASIHELVLHLAARIELLEDHNGRARLAAPSRSPSDPSSPSSQESSLELVQNALDNTSRPRYARIAPDVSTQAVPTQRSASLRFADQGASVLSRALDGAVPPADFRTPAPAFSYRSENAPAAIPTSAWAARAFAHPELDDDLEDFAPPSRPTPVPDTVTHRNIARFTGLNRPLDTVRYIAAPPQFTRRLSTLEAVPVLSFIAAYIRYVDSSNIALKIQPFVEDNVRSYLCSRRPGLTTRIFMAMEPLEVVTLLQHSVRPASRLAFIDILSRSVRIRAEARHSQDSPADLVLSLVGPLYAARERFILAYELLSEGNSAENIPPVSWREGGIARIWTKMIPDNFGDGIMRSIGGNTSFTNIYEFMRIFFQHVDEHVRIARAHRESRLVFDSLSSRNPDASATLSRNSQSTHSRLATRFPHNSPASFSRRHTSDGHTGQARTQPRPQPRTSPALNALAGSSGEPDELFYDPYDPQDTFFTPHEESDSASEASHPPSSHSDDGEDEEHAISDSEVAHCLALSKPSMSAAQPVAVSSQTKLPRACQQLLFYGSCSRGNACSFSHDRSDLRTAAKFFSDRLAQGPHLDATAQKNARPLHQALNSLTLPRECLTELLLEVCPESAMFSPCHISGFFLATTASISVAKVLLDTGASHANYVSLTFVDSNRDTFCAFLSRVSTSVTVADGRVSNITEALTLPVSLVSPLSGEPHQATLRFLVLPNLSTNDAIIGLPSIIEHFLPLFKELLDQALSAFPHTAFPATPTVASVDADDTSLQYPWTVPISITAPEDDDTPAPSSFPYALHFMTRSRDEAYAEYRALFDTHIDPAFRDATPIVSLLETKGAQVFIPSNWDGINGLPPLELNWCDNLPTTLKPKARPINPRLYEHAKLEFDRLLSYFYTPSTSPIASCLVIAPKATPPFIRFCGDYVTVNKYILTQHFQIPHVQLSLEKIVRFRVFVDLDMTNSFHQIRLGPISSANLSVQTPWAQVQPLFLPEGVPPASAVLQSVVSDVFAGFEDWIIAIFDNLLILATDYDDAYAKVSQVLDRCIARNVFLKFSKSWFGFDHANFFGYVCRHSSYGLSEDRKDALASVALPSSSKAMQSFLGSALFFKSFVPHYSSLVAPLHDMTKSGFDWSPASWNRDYAKIFDVAKDALVAATALFYPDYDLVWVLRTDASLYGVGAVLLQVVPATDTCPAQFQPLGFASQKFSDAATRWSTLEQECYGLFFGVRHFSYYLLAKPFILETDHNNLLWLEASSVPKVIRWRIYLQSYSFLLRHIPGKTNLIADFLSRAPRICDTPTPPPGAALLSLDDVVPAQLLQRVHNSRIGHHGARRTWNLLNDHFPGHCIPFRLVQEFVATCATCQKDRLGMTDTIAPVVRTLKPAHRRSIVGLDTLKVTPADSAGNSAIIVVVNHFTKLCALYPVPSATAEAAATALVQFVSTYGLFDAIITDPGTEFTNTIVAHLVRWLGLHHKFSLVDRHESNGVERTNASILRHLKALIFDERISSRWSHPTVLSLVQYILNSSLNSESGCVPFHAHFGTADATYFKLPPLSSMKENHLADPHTTHLADFVRLLDSDLSTLQDLSREHQARIAAARRGKGPQTPNIFQPGDLVLFQQDPSRPLPSKLSPRFLGPYRVLSQSKNDVSCEHINLKHKKVFHVTRLKLFTGSEEEAQRIAMVDNDQHLISTIRGYRGDPTKRTTVEMLVEFADGTLSWLPWSKDLFETVQYEEFCRRKAECSPLLLSAKASDAFLSALRKSRIDAVKPGQRVYVDLRACGHAWYDTRGLPDSAETVYLLPHTYGDFIGKQRKKIAITCEVFTTGAYEVDNSFVTLYASRSLEDWKRSENKLHVIDQPFFDNHPELHG